MKELDEYMLNVLISMLLVNLIIVVMMYVDARRYDPKVRFEPKYAIFAIAGALVGWIVFMPLMFFTDSFITILTSTAFTGLGGMGLIEKISKVKSFRGEMK